MNFTENFEGIKLDVQTVDTTIGEDEHQTIRKMLTRLRRHISEINWADIHLEEKTGKATRRRRVSIRLGIPGKDVFASDAGDNFVPVIKQVEEKLRRQLEKR